MSGYSYFNYDQMTIFEVEVAVYGVNRQCIAGHDMVLRILILTHISLAVQC